MIFRSLKMAGFKSFAESVELGIDSGLTGIVGPNGCGKSNVVEGLRWVMGESSARQMRGGEMDDIIFSGTEQRPARNLAEITLQVDNALRRAPAEFNDVDELEITRKIERGKGSTFYVNAKPVRARDINCCLPISQRVPDHPALSVRGALERLLVPNPLTGEP